MMLLSAGGMSMVAAAIMLASAPSGSDAKSLRSNVRARQSSGASVQPTPGMGFNTYNQVSCSPTEASSHKTMDIMASQGYIAAGYGMFGIDCGWVAKTSSRDSAGNLMIDTNNFPSGMKNLGAYATSKGLEFGLYSDGGFLACDPDVPSKRLGSLNHEDQDAALLKSFNVTYLKYDNCYAGGTTAGDNAPKAARTDFPTRFGAMSNALAKVGIQKMLVCQWGVPQRQSDGSLVGPDQWTKGLSTSYRLSDDIAGGWVNVVRILNQAIPISLNDRSGPGHFADGDLLEVGNAGMSIDEQASHFAFWAMIKSPLMISTDLSTISAEAKAILLNKGLIAVNQDKLGQPVKLVERRTNDFDLHAGNLSNGDLAVLAIDWTNSQRTIKIDFAQLGVESADVMDLWAGTTQKGVQGSFSKQVKGHGSIALRLTNIKKTSTPAPRLTYVEAESGVLAGRASKTQCAGCSNGGKVSNVGGGGGNTLTLSNIKPSSSEAVLYFDYINADVSFSFAGLTNERFAQISVNGGAPHNVSFPLSGYDWNKDVTKAYKVRLSGFRPGTENTITISNPNGNAPDFDRVGY
ncbi:carbohydrate-binding module family 35 protein [Moesziomyces antarcticus]|uniref:Alpha-galactosidase n=2 Tax=Pseudozyma antarctica TaxID=84753 RepID=A0A081CIS8_PSEA2|nr:carbohydrate-binding module family 35 protein [Moesziomyces antarcticus]GAK66574.1 carbohydrate-binding module family 35 protein [Moesziomyces antarcticus]SPO47622.1 related to Alpha-N-acetylgalactosaminidase precursor [Moesziomyces antarcticus]